MTGIFNIFVSEKMVDMMEMVLILILAMGCLLAFCWAWQMRKRMRVLERDIKMHRIFLKNVIQESELPLRQVSRMAKMLSKDDLYLSKNEKHNMAEQLNGYAYFIDTLLNELMLFTNSSDEVAHVRREQFSPNELCRRCLEINISNIYHRQAVKLNFHRTMSDEFFIESDRHVIEIILNKLIQNACRFTEKGEVVVGCNTTENEGMLTVDVSDTGAGIPKDRLSRLFSWFEQPDDMRDEAELDLSICQRLAQKIGGVLFIDELYARQGTRVVLVLPIK